MNPKKWMMLALCMACFVMAGCGAESRLLTASGSDEWSRGVVAGTTGTDLVAVAAWEDTTFVVWVAEGGQLRLAQLDGSLGLESVTDLALTTAYPRDPHLQAEAADRLHLTWVDSVGGIATIVHAQLVPGESEPAFRQEIPLPSEARYVQTLLRLEAGRLEIFWSASAQRDSGIYHQAVSLMGDEVTPPIQLTETGWKPGVGRGPGEAVHVAWVTEEAGGYSSIWHAVFDPEARSLESPAPVATLRMIRGKVLQGPAVGGIGTQAVLAWSTGQRMGVSGAFDVPDGGGGISRETLNAQGGGLGQAGSPVGQRLGDQAAYVLVPHTPATTLTIHPLSDEEVIAVWRGPRLQIEGNRAWIILSGWVQRHASARLQIVLASVDEEGRSGLTIVTKTWSPSLWPDLAVGGDGTLRATWLEPIGDDKYQIVVASTAPEALEALGGFRLVEWVGEIATVGFDIMGLLSFAPLVLGWIILPLGLVLVGTFVSPSGVRGWQAIAWLGVAALLQLACKRFLFPALLPLGPDPAETALSLLPTLLGAGLAWIYWRRVEKPLLLAAYGFFAGTDAIFSLFVMLPRLLWAA